MNILIPSHSHVQATRRMRAKPKNPCKNKNVKRAAPVEILKPGAAPKQEKITNACVLLRANDVKGVQSTDEIRPARNENIL
jgi:hypothetical protein